MRALRCLLALVLAAGLWLGSTPAAEARRAGPVLDRPTTHSRTVVLTGRARPRAVVALQVRATRWATVRRVRAAANGRYRVVVPVPRTARAYRAVSRGRVSTTRVVRPPRVTPPPVVTPPPADDACGARPPRRAGGFYSCTFLDEFDGTALDPSRWSGMTLPGRGGSLLCALPSPKTIAVSGGNLHLTVLKSGGELSCPLRPDGTRGSYVLGWATTWGLWSQQYGRFETRMRVQAEAAPGLHEGFWLWPDTRYGADAPWPYSGEIDIVETYSSEPDLAIPFLHYDADDLGRVPGLNTALNCHARRGEWHTYALEWTADRLEMFVDGRSCLVNTSGSAVFRKRYIINLTQKLGGSLDIAYDEVPLPATMQVDYVKVWQ